MEGRSVLLAKLPIEYEEKQALSSYNNVLLSPALKHVLVWNSSNKITLYSLSKQADYEHRGASVIWKEVFADIGSVIFSNDGKQLALLIKQQKKIVIYNVTDQEVHKDCEAYIEEVGHSSNAPSRTSENVCDSATGPTESEILIQLHKSQVTMYSSGTLSSFHVTTSNECVQNYSTSLVSEVTLFHYNTNFFYALDDAGTIYIYLLENGNLVGIYDTFKTLPKSIRFCHFCANTTGTQVALVESTNHVYILDISSAGIASAYSFQQQFSVPGSSASVSSFKTTTSKTSSYSRVDSLKRDIPSKKISSIANASTANTSWMTYLEKLSNRKKRIFGKVENSDAFICIRDIPNTYIIRNLHFYQGSLGIWATHPDGTSDGFYRVYDKSNGQLESADILAPNTQVISVDSLKSSLDLFLQTSNLCLPFGIISRDTLIQKMVGGENESQVDEMVGLDVSPLPLLQEGLIHSQLDMVRLALNLHTQGFRSKMSEEVEVLEELVESTKILFETIHSAVVDSDSAGQWRQQMRRLALTHANTLLSLLLSPTAQASLQTEILHHVVLLRRGESFLSVDVPVIPLWNSWLPLSDNEVILHCTTSLPLVHCFLALHRGWSLEELQGQRFNLTVQQVFSKLLEEEKLDQATELLIEVNMDPEQELKALCMKCQNRSLRDYLMTNITCKLKEEHYDAWNFLTLLESIFLNYNQYFPKFSESPLKISDILSLTAKDRSQILVDLYCLTGDSKLKTHLDKNACWNYLLGHNHIEGILAWLTSKSSDSYFAWPLELFSQWNLDQSMVDRVLSVDCTDLTKHIVCNQLATLGILTSTEKCAPEKLILRMAHAEVFPDVKEKLNMESSNLSYAQFSDIMLQHAIENDLVDLAVKSNLSGCDDNGKDWLKLFKMHIKASETLRHSDIARAVEQTTQFLASLESIDPSIYLKQHPLIAVVTDILKNQDICQLHCHVSPLLAAAVPLSPPSQDDITLYSVLSHTVPFHTDNIFQHQINNKKNSNMPDFRSENMNLRYGIFCSLGFKEFLQQGRPGSAISFILQKERVSVSRRAAVHCAHGLALHRAPDPVVAAACIAFVDMLGQDSSLLRTHVATARSLAEHMCDKKLKQLLFHLVQGREGSASELLAEYEGFLINKWTKNKTNGLSCLQEFHLAVRLSVCHSLPAPSALLRYGLETDNWLLFVLTAQLFQYPLSRVQEITTVSAKHAINKHLYHALHTNARNQTENGGVKAFEPETDMFACLAHLGNNADTLFSLSRQLNSPALALLASSLQPLAVETGLTSWLVASLSPEEALHCPGPPWSPDSVTQLLEYVVRQKYFYTLSQGFFIFQPINPFCALASFFIDSVIERKFKESVLNLKLFMAAFSNLPDEDKKESGIFMSKNWVAITAFRMACTALAYCFPSGYLRRCFLSTLCEAQFSDLYQDGKLLPLFLRLSECLADTALELDWKRLCLNLDFSHLSEVLIDLTEQHMFDTAFKFATIAGLPVDQVIVTQWSVLALTNEVKERDFWQRCETAFQQANIKAEVAVTFFRNQCASSGDLQERYVLLKYALNWMYRTSCKKADVTLQQIELYMTCLQEKFKSEIITEGVAPAPLRCLSESLSMTPVESPPQLSSSQYHRLDALIHQLLVVGDIKTAFLLQSLFHHTNQDCELLLACMRLAEGVTTLSQLPPRILEYLADVTVRRPKTTLKSPLPKLLSQNNLLHSDNQSILNALYGLQAHQTSPTGLFGNIICGFKTSVALNCSYKDVILDPEPLNRLLTTHDFDMATSLLNLASLTRCECTQYVYTQVVAVLSTDPVDGKYVLWSCDLENEFSCILDLSGSALMLGNLLLAFDPPMSASSSQAATYRQVVELLILAHNCFTRVCHMEGIATVLSLARSVVNRLLDCCHWPLMVRLLTGIGRYTEMSYIFQILKNNNQFEFLLGKGLDKPQLMSATLEFVRCDQELFSLVAHHFSMYSELAALYEEEARAELDKVEKSEAGMPVTAHTKASLQIAMSKYTDATEHYMQAKKMKRGVSSMQQAELIAVQMSLLTNTTNPSVPCLINLSNNEALQLINTGLSCEQAHIVASAYNVSVDWSAALYHNCVVNGDSSYLNSWSRHHQLNKTIVQDVVRRFQSEKEPNAAREMNMKWFVSSVNLLDVKYRVASQLGFKDILQKLLTSPDMAYLKDTVWQRGFKKQSV